MEEGDALFIRVCFPIDFEKEVKAKGKYDLMRLYEKGIVISVNELTSREEHSEELLTIMRIELGCHPSSHRVFIFDLDEFKDKIELWFDFVKDSGTFGDNYATKVLWFAKNIQAGSIIYSKQLNKEYDQKAEREGKEGLGVWHIKRHSREYGLENNKKMYIHTTLITAHEYLLTEPFYTTIEKEDYKVLWDALNNKTKKVVRKVRDPISNSLRHEVFKRDNYTCKECGRTNKQSIIHCDHIKPVSQGGTDELSNLQTLCEECNLLKKNRTWEAKGLEA